MTHRFRTAINRMMVFVFPLALSIAGIAAAEEGRSEDLFKVVPVQAIANPQLAVIRIDDIEVSRAQFVAYIRSVADYQMGTDLLQRDFMLRYLTISGIARFHPVEINDLMPRLLALGSESVDYKRRMDNWVFKQAELAGLLYYFAAKAEAAGIGDDPHTAAALDCFAAHGKAAFIRFLVGPGAMDATRQGLRDFAAGLDEQGRASLFALFANPRSISATQRGNAERRWLAYAGDVVKNADVSRDYENVATLGVPGDTVVLRVNEHSVTMADFLAIYGPIPNDLSWNDIKDKQCSQLIRTYTVADEADRLGLAPDCVKQRIQTGRVFYLAAEQIAREFGPGVLGLSTPVDFDFFKQLNSYLKLMRLRQEFWAQAKQLPVYQGIWVDKQYLGTLDWKIESAARE